MTISRHKRPDGRIAFRVQLDVEGERKSYGLFDDHAEAVKAEAAQKQTLDASAKGVTLGQLGKRFVEAHEAKHRGDGRYRSLWRHYVEGSALAKMAVNKIRLPNVVSWLRKVESTEATGTRREGDITVRVPLGRPVSKQTVAHAFHLLRSFFAWAIRDGKARQDPTADVRVGEIGVPLWTWLRVEEIAMVLAMPPTKGLERCRHGSEPNALTPAQRAIYTVAIYTGLRASELWQLRWNAVRLDGDRPEIVVAFSAKGRQTKTGRVRHVPLLGPAKEALEAWRRVAPGVGLALVWPGKHGKPHEVGFDAGWPKIAKAIAEKRKASPPAGERLRPHFHDLRHTCASHLVQGTWIDPLDLYRTGHWLGHASVQSTVKYAHLAPDGLHSVASATAPKHERSQ